MSKRILKIDLNNISDHCRLERTDSCYYFCEYTAKRGYDHSETNGLITNLKKTMDRRDKPAEWKYKEQAIDSAANMLRPILAQCKKVVFVPIPPSKAKEDPLYDDRMLKVLHKACHGLPGCYVRELILQKKSTAAVHLQPTRPSVQELIDNYCFNDIDIFEDGNNVVTEIVIVDDVLTTGGHFKAMQEILLNHFNAVNIHGIFIARRVPEPIAFPNLNDFDLI